MARYRGFNRRDLKIDLLYAARQSLHDDSLDEFNFTSQEWGLEARKKTRLLDREVIFGGRYDLLLGFLNGDIFSLRNRWTVSADTRWTPRIRSLLSYRLTASDFGPDGSNPPQTSRDGLYQDAGITQYLYAKDLRRYVFLEEEFNRADVRGGNFELRGNTTRVGVHTPLVWDTDLDLWSGLQLAKYPRFSSLSTADLERRRDHDWEIYVALTHHFTARIGLRAFYRFINADNRNGFFEYDRHIGGVQILFSETL